MLADHNRMAAYHSAILGNADVFKDKVVMDVGTGSGILAVWAAQAGAKRVYAGECVCLCVLKNHITGCFFFFFTGESMHSS